MHINRRIDVIIQFKVTAPNISQKEEIELNNTAKKIILNALLESYVKLSEFCITKELIEFFKQKN